MSRQLNRELSFVTSTALDCNGYSSEMISFRADMFRNIAENISEFLPNFSSAEIICAGSRGEGVAKLFESDIDLMLVFRNFLCLDFGETENGITVLKAHSINSPPGYTQLIPLDMRAGLLSELFLMSTTVYDLTNGYILISSASARNLLHGISRNFPNIYDGIRSEVRYPTGPSVPASSGLNTKFSALNIITHESDNVFSMPYISSTILETWKNRDRKHQWPPYDVIQDVSEMEGFVVPVGASFSEEQNYEWRICYTTAEQKLLLSLNPVLMKVYILLKMFFKEVVRPECDVISSYMIKNIILWVAELNDSRIFTVEKLVDIFLWCLAISRECLQCNRLPNFMIPSRNLLYGKVTCEEKTKLMRILKDNLNEGSFVVFRLTKVRWVEFTIERSLRNAFRENRDMIEKLFLDINRRSTTSISPAMVFEPTMFYDVMFDMFRDCSIFETVFTLLNILNISPLTFLTDFQNYVALLRHILS